MATKKYTAPWKKLLSKWAMKINPDLDRKIVEAFKELWLDKELLVDDIGSKWSITNNKPIKWRKCNYITFPESSLIWFDNNWCPIYWPPKQSPIMQLNPNRNININNLISRARQLWIAKESNNKKHIKRKSWRARVINKWKIIRDIW